MGYFTDLSVFALLRLEVYQITGLKSAL